MFSLRRVHVYLLLFLNTVLPGHAKQSFNLQDIPEFKHGLGKTLQGHLPSNINERIDRRIGKAKALAALEQTVEDINAEWIARSATAAQASTYRRLICLPLTETFDPPMGVFSHGHVQTGDKMSLPRIFWDAIQLNSAEVPWLFQVSRVEGVTSERVVEIQDKDGEDDDDEEDEEDDDDEEEIPSKDYTECAAPSAEKLDKVVGGPLDFRAPPNYIFLPSWMMRALGLKARDIVDVHLIETVAPGSLAKLRPLKASTMTEIANPQAVMETELRHYSALTKGSTIAFDYNEKRYWFEVAECRSAPRGEKRPMIKVQDCDIATDFLPAKDTVEKMKRMKKKKQED